MTKEKEALNVLVGEIDILTSMSMQSNVPHKVSLAVDCIDEALKKLEPFKPKEPILVDDEPSTGICNCGRECYSFENFCSQCGQQLDWSK